MENNLFQDLVWYSTVGFKFIVDGGVYYVYMNNWDMIYNGDNITHAFAACDLALMEYM